MYLRPRDTAEMLFFLERLTVARYLSQFINSYRESESSKSAKETCAWTFEIVVDTELWYKDTLNYIE